MARMYPRTIFDPEIKSKGEKRVFNAIRDGLDDDWHAFHSVGWVTRDHAQGSEDGEIDFVLGKVGEPIVCLEVKGGGLECRHGEWYRDKNGKKERFRDPFAQAVDHKYALGRALAASAAWNGRDVHIVHTLWFPDISKHRLVLPATDSPLEIVLDRNDLAEPEEPWAKMLGFHRGSRDKRTVLDDAGLDALRSSLAPDIYIKVPLATRFMDEEEAMITLTAEQAGILKRRIGNKRMVVRGCAGSGKTMLAVEIGKRFRRADREVLFVCFNRALMKHLREREKESGIRFQTFHGLCTELARKADIDLPSYPDGEIPPEYWREELPAALMEAADILGPQADVLIVDEAQDLHRDWLDALTSLLRDPEKDPVWLFMDDNQDVYGIGSDPPDGYVLEDLTVNCRNTQTIATEVHKKYKGEIEPEMLGPEGRELDMYETDDQPSTVAGIVRGLIGKEEVPAQDIVVLSSHGFDKSEVAQSDPDGFAYSKEYVPLGNYVRCSSIRGFKGLEAPMVILCELEGIDDDTIDSQLYVGFSRAKNHCAVVVPGSGSSR